MPEVSVIIPNYNHAPYLRERIDSVLRQTYTDFELIILDDCSTDHSRDIIRSYEGHKNVARIVFNETNSGSTFRQWEKGIRAARGNWIWLAESDDIADPGFLKAALEKARNDGSEMVFCNSLIIDEHSAPHTLYTFTDMPAKNVYTRFAADFCEDGRSFLQNWMLVDNFIPNASAVLFSARLVTDADNAFSTMADMRLIGDWYFWIFLLLQTRNISYLSAPLNQFRNHSQNVRSKTRKNRTTEFPYILELLQNQGVPLQKSFDAYLYRYFHSDKDIRWSRRERWAIAKNAARFGFTAQYLKAAAKHIL